MGDILISISPAYMGSLRDRFNSKNLKPSDNKGPKNPSATESSQGEEKPRPERGKA